jgi:hypothetical protein
MSQACVACSPIYGDLSEMFYRQLNGGMRRHCVAPQGTSLNNFQRQGRAFAATGTAEITRISAGSFHLHIVGAGSCDEGGGDVGSQLRVAVYCCGHSDAIKNSDGRRNELATRQHQGEAGR